MSSFTAKMHQIRFRPGSALDPARGTHSAPQTPSWIFGVLLLRKKGKKKRGKQGKGGTGKKERKRKRRDEKREGEGRGR